MPKEHGPSVKDDEQYEVLRRQGGGSRSSTGGKVGPYDDRSKEDLLQKARQVGIEGRSKMSKQELISALRSH